MGVGRVIDRLFPAFKTDRDEFVKVMLLFGYLFCVVSASTIGKTGADALFLSRFDNTALSFMYLPQALIMILTGVLFQRYASRVRLERLLVLLIPIIAGVVLLSRFGIGMDLRWVFPTIYIGYDVFNFLMIVCFWQFATSVMDQRKAKKMIGLVGSGGIAGGIVSGFGLKAFVPLLGTANLIYVYAALQLIALGFVIVLIRRFPQQAESKGVKAGPSGKTSKEGNKGLFKHVPHLKYVAILAAALVFSLQLIDYQFKVILRESLQNDALAGFMGTFHGVSGIVALVVQLFVSSWVITRYGVMTALLVFPVVLFAGSLGVLMLPVLAMAVSVKGSDKVVGDTIYSSVSQLIMFPVPPEYRTKAKSFLDGIARNGAKGLAAICLLAASQLLAPQQLSYVVIPLLGVAIFAAIKLKKAYLQTLMATLQSGKSNFERAELNLMDPASRSLLTDALVSEDRQQALYAFYILRDVEGFEFTPYLKPLLQHSDPKVRMEALAFIEQTVPPGFEEQLIALCHKQDSQVRAKAVIALAAYGQEAYLDDITALLEEQEPQIQAAAIAGLVKYYGIEGMFRSVGKLKQLIDSTQDEHRVAVAALFGQIGVRSFYKPLVALLKDPSVAVRSRALESAQALAVPALIPPIVAGLRDYETRRYAVRALAAYEEEEIIPVLREALGSENNGLAPHIPAVCEKVGTQQACDLLLEGYGAASYELRDRMLESLTRMVKKSALTVRPKAVEQLIEAELELYRQFAIHGSPFVQIEGYADIAIIVEQLRTAVSRRVFQLLGLLYEAGTIQAVYTNWSEGDARQQANAAEVIDQTVQGALRGQLAAFMGAARSLTGKAASPAEMTNHLAWLSAQGDDWLKEVIRHKFALEQGKVSEADTTFELLDRVHLLQRASLFQGLTSKELSNIAKRLQRVEAEAGANILQAGDPGDWMYIVGSGRVGVYREGRKLNELSSGECVGEMALFSEGRRTATILAEEATILWRLDSAPFYDLLFNHTSIAFEMMKLLSRRLRTVLAQGGSQQKPETDAAVETAANASTSDPNQLATMQGVDGLSHEMIVRRILTLQNIELFAHLKPEDFVWLAQSIEEAEYVAGQAICRTGEHGDTMYAIVSGQVRVHRGSHPIALLQAGEYFGEMAVIDSGPRSADCTADSDVIALALHRDLVLAFSFQNMNVLKSILRVLADRLKGM
ncbi:CRP-like cAMP-binding protein/ATP/ADP translocase/HEAT repeat protein [Paenibacillus phyllosphaerae]|uniref:ADP,ATP carrier protein n=1 Tax=Paenibacillus phyllosphaerae TaxID=274593 RepID=A0A7W5B536_9BACL|nr:Npt1/Npt2 family nucleotide transporter [Paenibacillus phyllosphaerae]MBB3114559.1 CRP-like cAMP-binding protein/ATP/ADP translocase/HEAT repeat protein [Paenibacillus phyllosphaerae]